MLVRCGRSAAGRLSASSAVLLVSLASALVACDDDEQPVDIPFKSVEPPPPEPAPKPDPTPEPSASNTAKAPTSYKGKPVPNAGRLSSCCGALSAAAKTKNSANSSMYTQAAKVCRGQVAQVRAGKVSVDDALASVRSSLLGSAPGACR